MSEISDPVGSIQGQLLRWLFSALALLLLVGAIVDYVDDALLVRRIFDRALSADVEAVSAEAGVGGTGVDDRVRSLLRAKRKGDEAFYLVIGRSGEAPTGDVALPVTSVSGDGSIVYRDAVYSDQPVRMAIYRAKSDDEPAVVAVAETVKGRRQKIEEAFIRDTAINFLLVLLTSAIAWLAVRRGLAPLRNLRDRVMALPAGNVVELPEASAPSEVRPLVVALNRRVAHVIAVTRAQQQFVADAAHQLRTPLAGLQTQLEVISRAAGSDDVLRGRTRAAHESARRLGRTANQLLALARTEASLQPPEEFAVIDLPFLIETCIERDLSRAIEQRIDLGAERSPARIYGVPWQLDELLSNLIDNAISYTPAGGRVTVGCGVDADDYPFLYVTDDGRGIPLEERDRACDRFYRVQGTAGVGSGLGLAIVREVSRLHAAAMTIGDGENGRGTRVTVRFCELPATFAKA